MNRIFRVAVVGAAMAGCAKAPPAVVAPPVETAVIVPPAPVMPTITAQQHDATRAQPNVARPSTAVAIRAPADATVLFDGRSLENWTDAANGPARWKIENAYVEIVAGTGDLRTQSTWGDVQLHLEWTTPLNADAVGQERGNSGVLFMGLYEVQILDSYGSDTYPDGLAGAVYGQYPPLVNASLPPGEWQSFDIVFHAPRFRNGQVTAPARMTVFQNGVLVQDDVALVGPTSHGSRAPYKAHAERLPITLENRGHAVRFRNIWVRELTP
jgi:hypothetical protein